MKYAFMTFSCPELSLVEALDVARRYGYDGIEPRIEAGHAHGIELEISPAQRAEARKIAEDSGLSLACLATSRTYSKPEDSQSQIDLTRRCIDLAADVGCTKLRVFGGQLPEGVTRDAGIDLVSASLAQLAPHASDAAVIVCLETHDDWCDPKHIARIMANVDQESIAVNWDIMHPVRACGVSIDDSFECLEPWIRHVHFHDGAPGQGLDFCPMGEGIVDHRRAVERLSAVSWPHTMSGEWINWEPYDVCLPREIATMRGYEG